MTRFTKSIDWLEMYCADRDGMLSTMARNMAADLECGYDYFGRSITEQRAKIEKFRANYDKILDMFKTMSEEQVNRWCFYELKKLGAIE